MERAPAPPPPPKAPAAPPSPTTTTQPLTTGPPTQPGTFALFPPGTTPAEAARLADPLLPLLLAGGDANADDDEEGVVRRLQAAFCRRLGGELTLALVRKGPELLLPPQQQLTGNGGASDTDDSNESENNDEWVVVARGSMGWTALPGQQRPARLAPWAVEGRGPTLRAAQRDACRRALALLAARGWFPLPPLPPLESSGAGGGAAVAPATAATAVAPPAPAEKEAVSPLPAGPQPRSPRPESPATPPQPERSAAAPAVDAATPSPPPAAEPPASSGGEIQPAPAAKSPRRRQRRRGGGGGGGRGGGAGVSVDADASAAAEGGQPLQPPQPQQCRGGGGRGRNAGGPVDADDEVVHGRVGRAHKHRVCVMRRSEGNPIVFLDMAAYERKGGAGDKRDKAAAAATAAPPSSSSSSSSPAQPQPLGRLAIELWGDLVPRAAELVRRAVSGDLAPRAGDAGRFGSAAEGPTPAAAFALMRPRRRGAAAGAGAGAGDDGRATGDKTFGRPPRVNEEEEEIEEDDVGAAGGNGGETDDEGEEAGEEEEGPLGRIHYPGQDQNPREDDDLAVGGLVVPASAAPLAPPLPPSASAAAGVDLSASADAWPRSHAPPPTAAALGEEDDEGGAKGPHSRPRRLPTIKSDDEDDEDESSDDDDDEDAAGRGGRDAAASRRRLARRLRRALERDVEQSARTAAVVRETLAEAAEEEKAKAKAASAAAASAAAAKRTSAAAPAPAPTPAPTPTPTYAGAYVDFAEPKGWVRFMPLPKHRHPSAASPPPTRPLRRAARWYRHHEGMRAFSGSAAGLGSCPLLLHSRPFLLSVAAEELEALADYYAARDSQAMAAAAREQQQQKAAAAGGKGGGGKGDDQAATPVPSPPPEFPGLPSLCVLTGPCHELDDGRVIVGQALAGLGTAREISQGPRERVPRGETGSELSSRQAAIAGARGAAMRPFRRVVLLSAGQLHPEPVVGGRVFGGEGGVAPLPPAPAQATAMTALGKWSAGAPGAAGAAATAAAPSPDDVLATALPMRDADGLWPLWPEDQPLLPAGRDPSEEVQFRLEVSAALRARGNDLLRQHHEKEKGAESADDNNDNDLALQAADRYDQARRYLGWTTLRSTGDLTHGQQFGLWKEETSLSLNRAAALLAAGKWAEAAAEAQSAARRAPNDARAHYRLGKARLELGELVAAEVALAEAVRLAPEDKRAVAALARCRSARRGRDAALGVALKGAFERGALVVRGDGGDEDAEEGKEKKAAPPPSAALLARARLAAAHERPRANPRLKGANSAASLPVHLQNYSWGFDDDEGDDREVKEEEEEVEEEGGVGGERPSAARSHSPALLAASASSASQAPPEFSPEELLVAAALASREPVAAPVVGSGDEKAAVAAAAPPAVRASASAPAPAPVPQQQQQTLQPPRLSTGDAARVREILRGWMEFA